MPEASDPKNKRSPQAKSPYGLCPRCGEGLYLQFHGLPEEYRPRRWADEAGDCLHPADCVFLCHLCGQGLGRVIRMEPPEGLHVGPDLPLLPGRDWPSWSAYQWAILRTLHLEGRGWSGPVLELPLPQQSCCFSFAPNARPLPAGALLRLWAKDKNARPRCPLCKGPARAHGFGGVLSTGGYACRCLHCGHGFLSWVGGLTRVGERVSGLLQGSAWALKGFRFGGVFGSDGAQLGQALELGGWLGPVPESGVELRAG